MTRYELAKKQVKARQNNQMGLLGFLLVLGTFYVAGTGVWTQMVKGTRSLRNMFKSLEKPDRSLKALGEQVAKDEVQEVISHTPFDNEDSRE